MVALQFPLALPSTTSGDAKSLAARHPWSGEADISDYVGVIHNDLTKSWVTAC